jgi:hypothetical protein
VVGAKIIPSGYKSVDRFIGGGFQLGYPWLFVSDGEAEGVAVSTVCILSFNFVARRFPTLIFATRHSWNISMESYGRTMPKTAESLKRAAEEERLLVVNLFTNPYYRPTSPSELYFDTTAYPSQVYWETTRGLEKLKSSKKPIFWRLSSLSDLSYHWPERKIIDALGPLLAWLHGKGAIGVATINRELTPDLLRRWAISLFPNVAYIETKLKPRVEYTIRITKSINPKVSHKIMRIKLTPRYEVAVG